MVPLADRCTAPGAESTFFGHKTHRRRAQNTGEKRKANDARACQHPQLFGEIRQPVADYLAIPEVSSENRFYIPIGFLPATVIATNKLYTIDRATLYHFGILSSLMHMAWTRAVCGRLESRYQYSAGIVYNNFPWPDPSEKQRKAVEQAAQGVLDARAKFPGSSFADLYDALAMPPELMKAHQALDRVVDAAYGKTTFASEMERVAFLFGRYQSIFLPLVPAPGERRKKAKSS